MEAVYSAVKAGQIAFAKSYAKEVATLGINVNVVAPGTIRAC
jgi:3-oxoacyl-[acyl-carrier protein] reductase